MSQIDQNSLNQALELLGRLVEGEPALHLVVCGGSSLLALGLIQRSTTQDVDVLARLEKGELVTAKPLPEALIRAAEQVAVELGFTANWFNTGPSEGFLWALGEVLKRLDHGDLIQEL